MSLGTELCILVITKKVLTSNKKRLSAELVLIGVEPGTLRFRFDVITHYTTAPQLIDYMSLECSMSLETELCIVLSSERVLTEHSCRRCRTLNTNADFRSSKNEHIFAYIIKYFSSIESSSRFPIIELSF